VATGPGKPLIQRSLVSPLLSGASPVDEATRARLTYSIGNRQAVLVELNLSTGASAEEIRGQFTDVFRASFENQSEQPPEPRPISAHYMRCLLTQDEISALADQDTAPQAGSSLPSRTIYRIWPDYRMQAHIDRSVTTIKADAATRSYATSGQGIVWAVIDSGIDRDHPHFAGGTVTDPAVSHLHRDFTGLLTADGTVTDDPAPALTDPVGHGTHVAGIVAGAAPADQGKILIVENQPSSGDLPSWVKRTLEPGRTMSGMAPKARLVSLKVLDANGDTVSSAVIAALAQIREFNADGRQLLIHGVNLSIGCDWFPDEFAAGQSPLCRELDQLVGTGVVAVVSAGNSGAGGTATGGSSDVHGKLSTITDPGNSIRAITVGSTHRYQPHAYGVTYTSSKGPTLDGRLKPDLVAPGEHITSAATGALIAGIGPLESNDPDIARYVEDSGTSMAAPHVSGAIAAFLSVRDEYIGQPDDVKQLFMSNATSLGRHEFFQGAGLVDLMRVLSNV
jgi:subtilisin family serine protease